MKFTTDNRIGAAASEVGQFEAFYVSFRNLIDASSSTSSNRYEHMLGKLTLSSTSVSVWIHQLRARWNALFMGEASPA
jgi:hypothetical protein